jgi:hypothetical protein
VHRKSHWHSPTIGHDFPRPKPASNLTTDPLPLHLLDQGPNVDQFKAIKDFLNQVRNDMCCFREGRDKGPLSRRHPAPICVAQVANRD